MSTEEVRERWLTLLKTQARRMLRRRQASSASEEETVREEKDGLGSDRLVVIPHRFLLRLVAELRRDDHRSSLEVVQGLVVDSVCVVISSVPSVSKGWGR